MSENEASDRFRQFVEEFGEVLRVVALRDLLLIVETVAKVAGARCFTEDEISTLVNGFREALLKIASRYGIQELPERSGLQWDFASLRHSLKAIRRRVLAAAEELSECRVPVPSFDSCTSIDERGKKVWRTMRGEGTQRGNGFPDIQGALIRALHPEGEGDGVDEDDPRFDQERLERMEGDSPGFAEMIQRLEEGVFPKGDD